jgi:hypothetical protein
VGQVLEEVVEVGPGLEVVGLGGLDQAVEQCAGVGAIGTAGEQPPLTADHERSDGVLRAVVVDFQVAVVEGCSRRCRWSDTTGFISRGGTVP